MSLCTTRGHEVENKNDFLLFCRPDEEQGSTCTDRTCSVIKFARAKQEKYVDNLSLNDNYQKNSLIKDAVFSFLVFSSSEQKS